ncbi:HIV TAT specific factor 1 [Aphelenchoides avenae]|nr:HIV TAT specific factor 1 [Aphelenchus avenae]
MSDFTPEVESDEEDPPSQQNAEPGNATSASSAFNQGATSTTTEATTASKEAATASTAEPERRYVNGRWLCYDVGRDAYLEYVDNEWKALKQQWDNAEASTATAEASNPYRCVVNGVEMVWNDAAKQWIPNTDINEDLLAYHHLTYGVHYDYDSMPKPEPKKEAPEEKEKPAPLTKEERRAKKREAAAEAMKQSQGWVDISDEKNTSVYVSGLPPDITVEDFTALMSKCGVVMKDPRSGKPKVKLYRSDANDGTCCYVKMESVELALTIIDGSEHDGHKIHVERAQFQMKGDFDPKKKKKRLSAAEKKRFLSSQEKMFEWKPEKPRNYRPISDCTVVLRNLFDLEEIDMNAAKIFDLKEELSQLCSRFGVVKKVVVYDTNPEGVATVTFESVEHSDMAVKMLNGRIVGSRVIVATLWDGKEKFKRAETEEERQRRMQSWENFLGDEDEEDDDEPSTSDNGANEQSTAKVQAVETNVNPS